jgi:hypothetical protein
MSINMKHQVLRLFCLLIAVLFVMDVSAQQSPAATATGKAGGANITINYSSPSVRGRKVWGELVPYGKVWRAGANQATTIEFDKDVTVEGKKVPKGKYSLYAIPNEKEWDIIINSQTGQWGITRQGETTRDQSKDVAVVKVKPKKSGSMNEALKYEVNNNGFTMFWENMEVPVSVK